MAQVGLLHPVIVAEAIAVVIAEDRSADLLRIMEIDENLARADLSPAERAAHQTDRQPNRVAASTRCHPAINLPSKAEGRWRGILPFVVSGLRSSVPGAGE